MYSKNDFRYYRENRLTHSDDFLAHYGVKGMKWRKHKNGLSTELSNIKYDLQQRQVGQRLKGNTVYDPVKGHYSRLNTKKARSKNPNESSTMTTWRDMDSGNYKIKRRTRKSKTFQAMGKITKAKDTSGVEYKAQGEKDVKKLKRTRVKNGIINNAKGTLYYSDGKSSSTKTKKVGSKDPRRQTSKKSTKKKMKLNKKTTVTFNDAKIK